MNRSELFALLHDIESNQTAFRMFSHAMQDRIRLAAHAALRGKDPRVEAYFAGFKAGLEQEVDAWNESDDEIWRRARNYAGGTT